MNEDVSVIGKKQLKWKLVHLDSRKDGTFSRSQEPVDKAKAEYDLKYKYVAGQYTKCFEVLHNVCAIGILEYDFRNVSFGTDLTKKDLFAVWNKEVIGHVQLGETRVRDSGYLQLLDEFFPITRMDSLSITFEHQDGTLWTSSDDEDKPWYVVFAIKYYDDGIIPEIPSDFKSSLIPGLAPKDLPFIASNMNSLSDSD